MLPIINKIGGYDKAHDVLKSAGVNCQKNTLFIQSYRGKMSSKFSLVLWEYCQEHGIPVTRQDFYKEGGS